VEVAVNGAGGVARDPERQHLNGIQQNVCLKKGAKFGIATGERVEADAKKIGGREGCT